MASFHSRSLLVDTDETPLSPLVCMETEEDSPCSHSNEQPITKETLQVDLNTNQVVSEPTASSLRTTPNVSVVSRSSLKPKPLTTLQARIASYKIHTGFDAHPIPKEKSNRSIIYDYGVRLIGVGTNNKIDKWHCLATENCNTDILIVKNTSNITNHLKRMPKVTSLRSEKIIQKKSLTKSRYSRASRYITSLLSDPEELNRVHELNVVRVIVKKYLPFNLVEDEDFRNLCNNLDMKAHFKNKMSAKNVKHRILELYVTTRDIIRDQLHTASEDSPLAMFHLNVDLWTSKVSHDKYCGMRIFFVDQKWEMRSVMLGIRPFAKNRVAKSRLSDDLLTWTTEVLKEFKLDAHSLYSSTSDAGSDVKRLCSVLLPSKWDWCVPHLTNCALVEAFGTPLDANVCKTKDFRCLLKKVKKIIEHVNKSTVMRAKFEDLQFQESGKRLRFIRDMPHRWLGTVRLMQRFLSLWDTIRLHYVLHEKVSFPVDDHKEELIECFSLMKPMGDLITMAQATNYAAGIEVFLELCRLKKTVLCPATPLPLYNPTIAGYRPDSAPIARRHSIQLNPLTVFTRVLLSEAMDSRFFKGYQGTQRSLILEIQVFLHPSYKQLRCLDSILSPSEAKDRRKEILDAVFDMMIIVAGAKNRDLCQNESSEQIDVNTAVEDTVQNINARVEGRYDDFADAIEDDTGPIAMTLDNIVEEELDNYVHREKVHSSTLPTRKLLSWWKNMQNRYPYLSAVARCVLGHVVSSAQIERDFGAAGMMISARRSQLGPAFVDMSLFLKLNFDKIPQKSNEITRILQDEQKPFLPASSTQAQKNASSDDDGDDTDKEDGLWG